MTKRNCIYIGLLAFMSFGLLIDAALWAAGPPSSLTANDLVQMIGIITLFSWWEAEDAATRDLRRSSVARVVTILIAPVGLAIYLYQTRPWKRATVSWVAFIGGVAFIAILTIELGDWLIAQGFFPPSFLHQG
ncbi:hypothetical protein ADU59_05985 [Pararhizobium polonicum]|uniref:Transmembrane protein n=1 Tax=Pararhizobium polonicum TaxID=1612624 RepID=A0A1C7P3S9_9HYPH|nr:hypothetical protein [Pararhizobium polonicum]OBZ95942.1 hypothetical protein ADU59_05985 [Pararhizobium polonicum]